MWWRLLQMSTLYLSESLHLMLKSQLQERVLSHTRTATLRLSTHYPEEFYVRTMTTQMSESVKRILPCQLSLCKVCVMSDWIDDVCIEPLAVRRIPTEPVSASKLFILYLLHPLHRWHTTPRPNCCQRVRTCLLCERAPLWFIPENRHKAHFSAVMSYFPHQIKLWQHETCETKSDFQVSRSGGGE